MNPPSTLPHRRDVDGLRGVAVLLVIAYHAFPTRVPGGFVGVDVFFVISGYLITSLLLADLASGDFSYLGFYARRFRRILPALLVVLAAAWLVGRLALLTDELEALGKHLLAGATFTSNFLLWKEAGYFDGAAELKPLLHLWSLSVEEQFYLLWPVLLAFWFRRRLPLLTLVGGAFALSFAANVLLVERFTAFTFYLLPTRFWELLIGCALACSQRYRLRAPSELNQSRSWRRELTAFAALALLGAATFAVRGARPYPGLWALGPTIAAALVIAAGPAAWLNRRVLANPLAVWLGLISYPLYLWHWPLLSLARLIHGDRLKVSIRLSLIAISFVLAWATWLLIERPIRARRLRAPLYVAGGLAALATVGTLGWMTSRGLLLSAVQKRMAVFAAYADYHPALDDYGKCFLEAEEGPENFAPDCYDPKGAQKTVLLWGDSFAQHLYPGVKDVVAPTGARILRLTSSTCPPIVGFSAANRPHCREVNDFIIEKIKAVKPTVVLLQAVWYYHHRETGFFDDLDRTIAALEAAGVGTVIVVGEQPVWRPSLPKILERQVRRGVVPSARTALGIDRGCFEADRALADHFARSHVHFIPIMDRLCDASGCLVGVGEDPTRDLIAFDAGHLTNAGSRWLVQSLLGRALSESLAP